MLPKTLFSATATLLCLVAAACYSESEVPNRSGENPLQVATSYLKAVQARDFETVYSYISDIDQRVRNKASYLRSQENLSGFALELSKQLAAGMKVSVINEKVTLKKAHFEVGYSLPTGDEISSQLFDWNTTKLNALPERAQQRIVTTLENLRKAGKMVTLQGHETLDLVRQKDGWKIFLDWPSRSRVVFKATKPTSGELEVDLLHNDFLIANNEPFQIDFTVKNRSPHTIVARLTHLVEPRRIAKNLEMIACGSLLPLRLRPGETREISSSYILGGDLSPKLHVSIVYEFTLEPEAAETKTISSFRNAKADYFNVK